MQRIWLSLVVVALVAVGSGCGSDEDSGDSSGVGGAASEGECDGVGAAAGLPPPIQWSACDPVPAQAAMAECAFFDVPVDYAAPSAGTYALELMRIPAANPADKSGTVLVNLGGPAVPATDFTVKGGLLQASELGQKKDIVAMNIRGASASTRPEWIPTAVVESLRSVDRTPDDDADWQALDSVYADLVEAILADTPAEKIATLGTRDTVRDMARLSAALGEERLDYLGFSYGSVTGAYFASQCPGRVGHFVLDAAVAPNADFFAWGVPGAKAVDKHLKRVAEICSKDPSCAFHGGQTTEQILLARRALAAKLEASGGVAIGMERKIFESDLHYATRRAIRRGAPSDLSDLWKALAAAEQDDWAALLALADANWGRQADGTYTSASRYWWVLSNDTACPKNWTLDAAKAAVAEVAKDAPELGAAMVTEALLCLHWPFPGTELAVGKTTAPPAFVVGGNLDANTPVEWAHTLASALDNGSYVVTHDQPGHVAWLSNDCVTALEVKFLLDGKDPGVTHCDAN